MARSLQEVGGWAEGMHPLDVFLKNTHEVLGPLHRETAHAVLSKMEFLTKDYSVRKAIYGYGPDATTVIVNFGTIEAKVTSTLGGDVILPPWGFIVEGSRFAAFHTSRWNGQDYGKGALFTLQAVDNKNLDEAYRVRIFHAFGPAAIRWKGNIYTIQREQVIQPSE